MVAMVIWRLALRAPAFCRPSWMARPPGRQDAGAPGFRNQNHKFPSCRLGERPNHAPHINLEKGLLSSSMRPKPETQLSPDQVNPPHVLSLALKDDGVIPNSKFPLLIYQGALKLPPRDAA